MMQTRGLPAALVWLVGGGGIAASLGRSRGGWTRKVCGVSILDDAREGMDPDIRPQDDLFGHVNGRWLERPRSPATARAGGRSCSSPTSAEQQVREIIEDLRRRGAERRRAADEDARKIGDLFASFMDEERIEQPGHTPDPAAARAVDGADATSRDLAAFLGEFERRRRLAALFGSYVDTDDRNSDRYLFNIVQGGLGLPDESYYRDDKFAEIREKYVAYLSRCSRSAERRRPRRRCGRGCSSSRPARQGPLGAGRHPRRPEDLQPDAPLDELKATVPSFDWDAYVTNLGGIATRPIAEAVRAAAVVPRAPRDRPRRDADRGLEGVAARRVLRAAAPYLSDDFVETNFDFYGRTLSGTPELRARWKRGVGLRRGRARRGRRRGVRRAALPAASPRR